MHIIIIFALKMAWNWQKSKMSMWEDLKWVKGVVVML